MNVEHARDFLREHHRAVLATRRRDGGVQMSPVLAGIDAEGRVLISSNEGKAKVANLRREPQASVCAFPNRFFGGKWVQVDGRAEIVSLPEAEELLVDYHERVIGEPPEDYRASLTTERACLIRITVERAAP